MSQQTLVDTKNSEPRRVLSIAEFVEVYGISRAKTYQLLNAGELRAVKAGRRTLIPVSAAEAWFNDLPEA